MNFIPYKDSILAASLSMSAEATHTIPRISRARRISITRVSKMRALMPCGQKKGKGGKNTGKNSESGIFKHKKNTNKYQFLPPNIHIESHFFTQTKA